MNRILAAVIWVAIAALGAFGFGMLALSRGETISAAWILVAGVCTYLVAYRFYARFIAGRIFDLDARRATPAERLNNGRDFHPTNRWIAYGHHFAAISGAGPLIGPTLAAQFGFLPGTIWLIAGVVLGGAVQDFTIIIATIRRDGKSVGKMAKEEVNPVAGMAASVLPVRMLLAPGDYLSTFLKIGTLLVLAGAILILLRPLKRPAVTQFAAGTGPVFAG